MKCFQWNAFNEFFCSYIANIEQGKYSLNILNLNTFIKFLYFQCFYDFSAKVSQHSDQQNVRTYDKQYFSRFNECQFR